MPEVHLRIYTIGHSNHPIDKFLDLLKQHQVDRLVDTRSHPYSRFSPHFNQRALREHLAGEGIQYEFLGDRLGGRPKGPEFYDSQGYVLYGQIAQSATFREALERVKALIDHIRLALLCSEENPSVCHRRLLIGRVLFDEKISVLHIRGDGRLQTEEELRREDASHDQPDLFVSEDASWKSTRPVIR